MPLHAHLTQAALPEKCELTTWAVCRETYAAVLCGIPRSGWTYHVVVVVTAKLAHHGAAIQILDHGTNGSATISMVRVHSDTLLNILGPGTASIVFHLAALVQQPLVHGLLKPNAAWASTMKTSALYFQH